MMNVHGFIGTKSTTYHDFKIVKESNALSISPGELWINDDLVFSKGDSTVFILEEEKFNRIIINDEGLSLVDNQYEGPLFIELAWGTNDDFHIRLAM